MFTLVRKNEFAGGVTGLTVLGGHGTKAQDFQGLVQVRHVAVLGGLGTTRLFFRRTWLCKQLFGNSSVTELTKV